VIFDWVEIVGDDKEERMGGAAADDNHKPRLLLITNPNSHTKVGNAINNSPLQLSTTGFKSSVENEKKQQCWFSHFRVPPNLKTKVL